MRIRQFQPGDEDAQAGIYNTAAAALPKFKPATSEEVRRRTRQPDFDPATRFYAEVDGKVVGYAMFSPNGRVNYPWCLPGHEGQAGPLFQTVLAAMKARGLATAFAAYRGDWPVQEQFFLALGFHKVREMVNFVLDLADMPTQAMQPPTPPDRLRVEDLPALRELAPGVLRLQTPAELERYFFQNAYFGPEAVFAIRDRRTGRPLAIGLLIANATYANPKLVDSAMPCFRLGAFGTEGMTTKRINGLFSFIARPDADLGRRGVDLLGEAATRLEAVDGEALAAQVPSDTPLLMRFYQQYFRRQASFPIFERNL